MPARFARWGAGAATLAGGVALAVSGGAASGGSPDQPTSAERAAATAPIQEAIPGSEVAVSPTRGGFELAISTPQEALSLPAADDQRMSAPAPAANERAIPAAQLAWKAQLSAAVAATRDPKIVGFTVEPKRSTLDREQSSYLRARLRRSPGDQTNAGYGRLGTVSVDRATSQLASNLRVLARVMPSGAVTQTSIHPVHVDRASNLFGLEVDIKVVDLQTVRPYLGDVMNGLATGLIGNRDAVVEGLAINLIDAKGQRAGWWSTTRAGIGTGIPSPTLAGAPIGEVHADFPNLTGGPPPIRSVPSQPTLRR